MKAGNKSYNSPEDIPEIIPIFPLSAALLLPGAHMPMNIFEPRYLSLIDDALRGDRLVGMIQPSFEDGEEEDTAKLCDVGCVGRITAIQEAGDGRYLLNLSGICRFRLRFHRIDESCARSATRVADATTAGRRHRALAEGRGGGGGECRSKSGAAAARPVEQRQFRGVESHPPSTRQSAH